MAALAYEPGSFLSALSDDARSQVLHLGSRRSLKPGSPLFVEGDESDRVLLLLSGRAKIYSTEASGRESVLAIRGPGDLLGELSAVDREPRSASAATLEQADVVTIAGSTFREALDTVPGLATTLLFTVVSRLRDADRKRAEFGSTDAARRVARRLLELVDRYSTDSDDSSVAVPISQDDLAAWTGASREAVSRALGDLRRTGIVDTGRRSVRILALDRLRTRAL